MLIEFALTNFRAIHEKQTFSMVASADQRFIDKNCSQTEINAIPHLLNSAAIYGPNASGKSSLIAGIECMRNLVLESAVNIREGQVLKNIVPFRFSSEALDQPSEFEIHFIDNDIRYQYGFTATATRITHEWLFAYVGRKSQRWFERTFDVSKNEDVWHFGSYFSGGTQKKLWKDSTRPNALFLSVAVNLNCEQLKPVFYWFANKLPIVHGNMPLPLAATLDLIKNEENKLIALQFLQAADLGITDIQVEMLKGFQTQVKFESGNVQQMQAPKEVELPKITFFHGKEGFDLSCESHGTQRLLAYVGFFLDALKNGKVLIVDEIEASLHSKLSRFLIELFHNAHLNQHKAQLIFSTHDTSLLDNDLFRRDQIWFMEKDKNNAARLYPLTDFSPRTNEALEKGYLQGRYGALPFFGELKLGE